MAFVIPSFMWADIVRMYHYIKKNMLARSVTKVHFDDPKLLIPTDPPPRGSKPTKLLRF
jgi:hypothetical protein